MNPQGTSTTPPIVRLDRLPAEPPKTLASIHLVKYTSGKDDTPLDIFVPLQEAQKLLGMERPLSWLPHHWACEGDRKEVREQTEAGGHQGVIIWDGHVMHSFSRGLLAEALFAAGPTQGSIRTSVARNSAETQEHAAGIVPPTYPAVAQEMRELSAAVYRVYDRLGDCPMAWPPLMDKIGEMEQGLYSLHNSLLLWADDIDGYLGMKPQALADALKAYLLRLGVTAETLQRLTDEVVKEQSNG